MRLNGDKELMRNLRNVGRGPTSAQLDAAMIEALLPLKHATESLAPRPSLKSGVAIAKRSARGRSRKEFWVSFKRGMAMRIAHLVEFGTAPHSLAKGASRRKGIMQDVPPFHPGTPAEPFFRPAFEATKGDVVSKFGQRMFALITASIRGVATR